MCVRCASQLMHVWGGVLFHKHSFAEAQRVRLLPVFPLWSVLTVDWCGGLQVLLCMMAKKAEPLPAGCQLCCWQSSVCDRTSGLRPADTHPPNASRVSGL